MRVLPKFLVWSSFLAPLCLRAQLPLGQLYASDVSVHGSVSLTESGTTILSGSSISSGSGTAVLRFARGGELAICSGTRVTVSASGNGRDLMFSFGDGTIETRYWISAAVDTIMTPDLRLVITGPGEFDLAVKVAPNGNTCVRSAKNSTGGVIVSELMGDGSYQVKPAEFILFPGGHVSGAQLNPGGITCGCPVARPAAPAKLQNPQLNDRALTLPPALEQAAPPASAEQGVAQAQADLRLAYQADADRASLQNRIIHLSVRQIDLAPGLEPAALPPALKPQKRGFWKCLASWFGGGR